MVQKNMNTPDEIRTPPKTRIEVVNLDNHTIMRATFQPGWKWSECVKPTAGTNSCQVSHVMYIISGKMKIVMDNGAESEAGPGDAAVIPPGHDAWIIGNEPCVAIDFAAGHTYAK